MQSIPDFHTNQETWDRIAESFDSTRTKTWEECIDFIQQTKQKGIAVDLGCGNGRHLIPLAHSYHQTIGVDISRKLLSITKQKLQEHQLKNTNLIHASLTHLPIISNSIQTALYIAALHNIRTKELRIKSLKELRRILTKKGNAIISVWARNQPRFIEKIKNQKQDTTVEHGDIILYWRQHQLNVPRFYHLYTQEEFISDLTQANLQINKIKEGFITTKTKPDNYFAIVRP